MRALFVDTWGWIAYFNRDDDAHERASSVLEAAWTNSLTLVFTSWPVVLETVGFRGRRSWKPEAAREVASRLRELLRDDAMIRDVLSLSAVEMREAVDLKLAQGDPKISLVDCTIVGCCRRLGIVDVLIGDSDLRSLMPEIQLHPASNDGHPR